MLNIEFWLDFTAILLFCVFSILWQIFYWINWLNYYTCCLLKNAKKCLYSPFPTERLCIKMKSILFYVLRCVCLCYENCPHFTNFPSYISTGHTIFRIKWYSPVSGITSKLGFLLADTLNDSLSQNEFALECLHKTSKISLPKTNFHMWSLHYSWTVCL